MATPHSGIYTCRPPESIAPIYDMSAGTGDLYKVPQFKDEGACGMSVSPDGAYIVANNNGHNRCWIVDGSAHLKTSFGINQWSGPDNDRAHIWQFFRWSINSQGLDRRHPRLRRQRPGPGPAMTNAVLYNWTEQRQIQVTRNTKGSFDVAGGFWDANAPIDVALGLHFGEAPLTVRFPAESIRRRMAMGLRRWHPRNGDRRITHVLQSHPPTR